MNTKNIWRIGVGITILVITLVGLVSMGSLFENNPAGDILVIQAPWSGELTVYSTSGMKWQGWGKATHYRKSNELAFQKSGIKIRFNDGGHADVRGSARFDLPIDEKSVIDFHQIFGSQETIEQQLIRPNITKAIYMTGPLMTSKESYAEKRSDLINLVDDQASRGVYQTRQVEKEIEDPITGQKKHITVSELNKTPNGEVLRQEASPLIRFNIALYNITINDIDYEDVVDKQIKTQQQATMDVQIAIANSKKAEQDALTAEKQGQAEAAKARWGQEVEKAKATTLALQQKEVAETDARRALEVATLARQEAEQTKQKEILLGEGESTRKKMVMAADGALQQKLEAFVKIRTAEANAIAQYKGALVPAVIMGGNANNTNNNSVTDLMNMLNARAAKDLAVSLDTNQNQVPTR